SRRRHTRFSRDWSSDVCSSDLLPAARARPRAQCHPVADDSQVTLAHIMSEGDINLYGTIHGGVVMKLIDDATAAAARHAGGPRRSEERRVGKEGRSRRARQTER